MKPWETLATAQTPDGTELVLRRHDGDYVIRADGYDLMVSRMHGSEQEMARLACPSLAPGAEVLVGGLGMGYTLRALLDILPADGIATVGELIPEIVEWNRGLLGVLAGSPLEDPRTRVEMGDVGRLIRNSRGRFDAILLDVDNGPEAFTQRGNSSLYSPGGLDAAWQALKPHGAFAVWSTGPAVAFEAKLRRAGFTSEVHRVSARGINKGPMHAVYVGRKRA